VLKSDKEKPKSKQPSFEFRILTAREWQSIADLVDSLSGVETGKEAINKIFEVLRKGLVGWNCMWDEKTQKCLPYEPEKLEDILTLGEAQELMVRFRNQNFEADDEKNSG